MVGLAAPAGRDRDKMSSQLQGRTFELTFFELLERLLRDDLGYTDVELTPQPSGPQHGKDLQARWHDRGGRSVCWHFECKSHVGPTLPKKEVADKILDAARSSHPIDAWCLAAAHAEPSSALDETLAWSQAGLQLPFALTTLTRRRHALKQLYALHPDLFADQYPDEAPRSLDAKGRKGTLTRFESFLQETTRDGQAARLNRHGAWQVVSPGTITLAEDDPNRAAAYLKGLVATPPWEAVAYDWATPRPSATRQLLSRVEEARAGLDYCWLVGAGGEGKSTVLRQLAWSIGSERDDWIVLWSDRYLREEQTTLPLPFIDGLPDGTNVLVCIDDSEGIKAGDRVRREADDWAAREMRVVAIVADRGVAWHKSTLRKALARGMPEAQRRIDLAPIGSGEVADLIERLDKRGLLHKPNADAKKLLSAGAARSRGEEGRSYLLPVMLQLTDPSGRGFDSILRDVLWELAKTGAQDAQELLLAASIVHGAGLVLTDELAAAVTPPGARTEQALLALSAELERQFSLETGTLTAGGLRGLVTHHRVLADGYVEIAAMTQDIAPTVLRVAQSLPNAFAAELDLDGMPLDPAFKTLDRVTRHLIDGGREGRLSVAAAWLTGWESLSPRAFPVIDRLAHCRRERLHRVLEHKQPDEALVNDLVAEARADYRRELTVMYEVLDPEYDRPVYFRERDIPSEELVIWHGMSVLEGVVGERLRDEQSLWRSAYLALLSMGPDRRRMARSLATLTRTLLNLPRVETAAATMSAYQAIGGADQRENIAKLSKRFRDKGTQIPSGGSKLLDEVIGALVPELLSRLAGLEALASYRDQVLVLAEFLEWFIEAHSPNEHALKLLPQVRAHL